MKRLFKSLLKKNNGHPEEVQISVLRKEFDKDFYIQNYYDIDPHKVDPTEHFFYYGSQELRDPCDWFSTRDYLETYPDVKSSDLNPFYHYIKFGRNEGRKVVKSESQIKTIKHSYVKPSFEETLELLNPHFDSSHYLKLYSDIDADLVSPIEHYVLYGWRESRDPAPWFSSSAYLEMYPDLRSIEFDPLSHYLLYGESEGRVTKSSRVDLANGAYKLCASRYTDFTKKYEHLGVSCDFINQDAAEPTKDYDPESLYLHWVIPDFGIGGGGHMTIFRMIRWLEIFGHKCTIWVLNPTSNRTPEDAYDRLIKHYQTVTAQLFFVDKDNLPTVGDAVIATSWQTVDFVCQLNGFKEKFYFIQDFEPYFYPRGAAGLLAEETYTRGLSAICASPWLKQVVETRYNGWARSFMLAYDKNSYFPRFSDSLLDNEKIKIAVYSRIGTERRSVELVLISLDLLAKERNDFEVHFFGGDLSVSSSTYDCIVHGILSLDELGVLYRECDFGVCFSATNYSLVPQEMMACGLPLMELDVESTRAIFDEDIVEYALPNPIEIKDKLTLLIVNKDRRLQLSNNALKWVADFSWEKSAKDIESALIEKFSLSSYGIKRSDVNEAIKASVVIPIYNGGQLLLDVIEAVKKQRAPWDFEIIIIDSESSDQIPEILRNDENLKYVKIKKEDFGHGKTRNYGVELSQGDYVAFLTQDALPTDEFWLYNLVALLEHFPNSGGVFGRHIAWGNASPYTKAGIQNHFDNILNNPVCLSKDTDKELWGAADTAWRQALHFYSDNNSCLRRSVWDEIPMRDIDYGEDQCYALDIITAGYEKLYSPHAVVNHSHDYSYDEAYERFIIEAKFFGEEFGYDLKGGFKSAAEMEQFLNDRDVNWGIENSISSIEMDKQKVRNRAMSKAYFFLPEY